MRSTIGLDLDGHIGNMDIFTGSDYNKRLETGNDGRKLRCDRRSGSGSRNDQ